jgi:hypothetical protein
MGRTGESAALGETIRSGRATRNRRDARYATAPSGIPAAANTDITSAAQRVSAKSVSEMRNEPAAGRKILREMRRAHVNHMGYWSRHTNAFSVAA